jgi:hypothetical protein
MERGIAVVVILMLLAGAVTCLNAQRKSPGLALGLSFGVPIVTPFIALGLGGILLGGDRVHYVSAPLMTASFVFGPSTGHFYAHQWGRGLLYSGLRCGFAGIAFLGAWGAAWSGDEANAAMVPLVIGVLGVATVTLIDIASAPSSAHKYNESLRASGKVHIMPRFDTRNERYGISVVYRF